MTEIRKNTFSMLSDDESNSKSDKSKLNNNEQQDNEAPSLDASKLDSIDDSNWTVHHAKNSRRLAPSFTLSRLDLGTENPRSRSNNTSENVGSPNTGANFKKKVLRFTRDDLISLRKPTKILDCMKQHIDIISFRPVDPVYMKPLDQDEIQRLWSQDRVHNRDGGRGRGTRIRKNDDDNADWAKSNDNSNSSVWDDAGAFGDSLTFDLADMSAAALKFQSETFNLSSLNDPTILKQGSEEEQNDTDELPEWATDDAMPVSLAATGQTDSTAKRSLLMEALNLTSNSTSANDILSGESITNFVTSVDPLIDSIGKVDDMFPQFLQVPSSFMQSQQPILPVVEEWFYMDPQNNIQGPFSSDNMRAWNEAGYFTLDLPIKLRQWTSFFHLSQVFPNLRDSFRVAPVEPFQANLLSDFDPRFGHDQLLQQRFHELQLAEELRQRREWEANEIHRRQMEAAAEEKRRQEQQMLLYRQEQQRQQELLEEKIKAEQAAALYELEQQRIQQMMMEKRRREFEEQQRRQFEEQQLRLQQEEAMRRQDEMLRFQQEEAMRRQHEETLRRQHEEQRRIQEENARRQHDEYLRQQHEEARLNEEHERAEFIKTEQLRQKAALEEQRRHMGVNNSENVQIAPLAPSVAPWAKNSKESKPKETLVEIQRREQVEAEEAQKLRDVMNKDFIAKSGWSKPQTLPSAKSLLDIQNEEARIRQEMAKEQPVHILQKNHEGVSMSKQLKSLLGVSQSNAAATPSWSGSSHSTSASSLRDIMEQEKQVAIVQQEVAPKQPPVGSWAAKASTIGSSPLPSSLSNINVVKVSHKPTSTQKVPAPETGSFWDMKETPSAPVAVQSDDMSGLPKEFADWCSSQLKRMNVTADFGVIQVCFSMQSTAEIRECLAQYLGSTPQVSQFASEFIRRKEQLSSTAGKKKRSK